MTTDDSIKSVEWRNYPVFRPLNAAQILVEWSGRTSRRDMTIGIIALRRTIMLLYALIVFAIGALGGLTLAGVYVLRGRLAPWALSLLHAALGAIGLLLLIYAALTTSIPRPALVALV